MQFSLAYFSAGGTTAGAGKYNLVLEGARFADTHGFNAVWLPERHFQEFGGLYPNPSVLASAIAAITRRVRIRSGSVVVPLHHPVRISEEWAVVDNLSGGRVDLSFASGWHPTDFVLSGGRYEDRKQMMFDGIHAVQRLWSGEGLRLPGPEGRQVDVQIFPKPIQKELRVWITTSGSPQTWQSAGQLGANVLAALIGDSMGGLASKVDLYRKALVENGRSASDGRVTVMVHTFLGKDTQAVKALAREPLSSYVRSYIRQKEDPNLKKRAASGVDLTKLSEDKRDDLVAFAFERYFQGNALLGTVDRCVPIVEQLRTAGVDEIACLVDFGVASELVLDSLEYIDHLRMRCGGSA